MNEGIVYTDEASMNWEALLRRIGEDERMNYLDLSDSKADLYDFFSDELRMCPLRERLLEVIQTSWTNLYKGYEVRFGNKFFATMSEQQQRGFLRAIFTLRVRIIEVGEATNIGAENPAITIHTSALLDALADLEFSVGELRIGNFALSNQSDVEALANIILAKRESLHQILLNGIECPITNNERDRHGPVRFLDPLLHALSCLEWLYDIELSARTPSHQSSLVSTNAVGDLFGVRSRLETLCLHGLGLNDSHCHVIAEELQTTGMYLNMLNLRLNPAISADGYGALFGLINGFIAVNKFYVDDERWEATLNLVSEMNHSHGRFEYMTDGGAFSSEERRWQWLQNLASFPSSSDEDDARQVNFIWYELVEHPEFMMT